ncbi:hypothetical protein OVA07_17370 [Novosphingobium sp. SL115]|uniref:hypothetical protein n=1 Tax=Novosphingobium sp. SL115 TaxID=2995150 RepID=UPI002276AC32|nr:hypothetical protein [Novosphingobium sp. SL115]MCY1672773.1 hypothetical protein [Novosphingobium sp. SL115]
MAISAITDAKLIRLELLANFKVLMHSSLKKILKIHTQTDNPTALSQQVEDEGNARPARRF